MPIRSRNNWLVYGLAALLLPGFLASCASMAESKLVSSIDAQALQAVNTLELRLPGLINRPDPVVRLNLERDINQLLASPSSNKAYQARLWGLLAETAWIGQDRPLLDKAVREMQQLDANQPRLSVALSRLAKATDRVAILQKAIAADPDAPQAILKLELALVYFGQQRFREAAASFDDAFPHLETAWLTLYSEKRNLAYRQKDQALAQTRRESDWLSQREVNLESMIGLALQRTSYLDRYGKENSHSLAPIARQLAKDGFLLSSDSSTDNATWLQSNQSRIAAAWFLFRIAVIQENRPDLLTGGKTWSASPIPDLALEDSAFRAVLGVVQREILNLPDGSNFYPLDNLLTSDYLKALDKLRSLYP